MTDSGGAFAFTTWTTRGVSRSMRWRECLNASTTCLRSEHCPQYSWDELIMMSGPGSETKWGPQGEGGGAVQENWHQWWRRIDREWVHQGLLWWQGDDDSAQQLVCINDRGNGQMNEGCIYFYSHGWNMESNEVYIQYTMSDENANKITITGLKHIHQSKAIKVRIRHFEHSGCWKGLD